jgi:hypothetical protein
MCCILAAFLIVGARGVLFLIWLFQPVRFDVAFNGVSFLVPLLGFLFLPWTTLMYVLVAPGGIDTVDAFALVLAVVIDLGSYASGGISGRNRYSQQQVY